MEHRSVEEQVAGLRAAVGEFAAEAAAAGLETRVPTAPAWTVRKLVAHQGMVHRWARANLLREDNHPPTWNAQGQAVEDPVAWLVDGAEALVRTLESVPDDTLARVFLKDAPPPRLFWARRQCHETTIHAVDALAARLGRPPQPEEARVPEEVALDGIDEVLTGFITRGSSCFTGVDAVLVHVLPAGHDRGWSVRIRDGAAETLRMLGAGGPADDDLARVTLAGPPVALYLALWNRTSGDAVDDPAGFLGLWRDRVRVRWS